MIVVHIFSALHQGGAENQFEQIFAADKDGEYTHLVISMKNERSKLSHRLEESGLPVYFFNFSGLSFFSSLYKARALLQNLKRVDKVVIQCWMYHGNLAGWMLSLLAAVPLIWSIRRTEIPKGLTGVLARASAFLACLGKFPIVSNSYAGKVSHQNIFYPPRIQVIGNGFSTAKQSGPGEIDSSPFKFVHIGRFAPIKGQSLFTKSAIKLLDSLSDEERRDISFTYIGRDVETSLKNVIISSGYEKNFMFLGEVESPRTILCSFSCYVLSSISEGSPNSLVESMLESLPCISSDVGDARRILNSDSWLYNPFDTDRLTELMEKMFRTPLAELREIGAGNRGRAVKCFGVESIRGEYKKLYKEVAK